MGHSVHCIVSRQGVSAVQCRIRDFRCKEVINVCDGCRLGYVSDLDVRVPEGQVVAIIVYGPGRFFGLFGRGRSSTSPGSASSGSETTSSSSTSPFSGGIPAWSGSGASVADKCPRGFHRGGICVCRRSGHGSSG